MRRNAGFTLVELLVVVAIISILAGIVLPNVPKFIAKARMARTQAEIRSIQTSLQKMLTDTNRDNFAGNRFFSNWNVETSGLSTQEKVDVYTQAFYILLKNGRLGDLSNLPHGVSLLLHADVAQKMGTSYMDVTGDPWGQLYQFYAGPWIEADVVPFRIYRPATNVPGGPVADTATEDQFNEDGESTGELVGFPAKKDEFIFVWSKGQNLESNQAFNAIGQSPDFQGGGDDINSWDKDASYSVFYS